MGEECDLIKLTCPNYQQVICQGVKSLYESKNWTDLVLNVNGSERLVHTFMMYMFAPKVIQHCEENRCHLPGLNIDKDTLTSLLDFIYNGRVEIRRDSLLALARAADLLDVKILKTTIEKETGEECRSVVSPPNVSNCDSVLQATSSRPLTIGKGAVFKCSHCEFKAETMQEFREHLERVHQVNLDEGGRLKLTYKCKDCDFVSENKLSVVEHRKSQHQLVNNNTQTKKKMKKFKCCHCDFVAYRKVTVSIHIKTVHKLDGGCFKCEDCDFQAKTEKILDSHKTNTHGAGEYKCNECGRRFLTNAGRLKHHIRVHVQPEVRNSCHLCDFRTKLTADLRKHLGDEHNIHQKRIKRPKIYTDKKQCSHCGWVLKNRTFLIDHLAYKHRVDLEGNPIQPKYKCRSCDFVTYSHVQLYRHNYKLHSKVEFRCEHCDFKARARKVLSDHVQWKHFGIKSYMCEVCGRCFSTSFALASHRKIHSPTSTPKATVSKPKRAVAESDREFECDVCKKTFAHKAHLKQHIYHVHDEDARRHQCDLCSYAAKTKWNLNKHVRSMHKSQVVVFQVEGGAEDELKGSELTVLEVQGFQFIMQGEEQS